MVAVVEFYSISDEYQYTFISQSTSWYNILIPCEKMCENHNWAFKNYVDHFLPYFNHLPTYLWLSCLLNRLIKQHWHLKNHLPTSFCQRSFWMPPYYLAVEAAVASWRLQYVMPKRKAATVCYMEWHISYAQYTYSINSFFGLDQ